MVSSSGIVCVWPAVVIARFRKRHARWNDRRPTCPAANGCSLSSYTRAVLPSTRISRELPSMRTASAIQRSAGTGQGTSRIGSQLCRCRPRRTTGGSVESENLVADELIGPPARLAHLEHQSREAGRSVWQEDLGAGRAGGEGRLIDDHLGAGSAKLQNALVDRPGPAIGLESFHQQDAERRLLKALAEDHLAVEAAIDLVVDILDARPGQQPPGPAENCVRLDADARVPARAAAPARAE